MRIWNQVAIVGVGLIGGSIGLDLLGRGLAREVVGIGRRASSLRTALGRGAVTSTTTQLQRGVAKAELIVVCTPVGRIVEDVIQTARACPPGARITDAGSTKGSIVAAIEGAQRRGEIPAGVHFVGSHPMAGSEKQGPSAASCDLFEGRPVVVTPGEATPPAQTRKMAQFWRSLGGRVVTMTPAEHDRLVAQVSHLPRLVAAALAASTGDDERRLSAGGWRDTTRVAASDPQLWQQILLDNRDSVLTSLTRFEKVLDTLRRALERRDVAALVQLLTEAKRSRDALGS